jgi:hypothetical protein
VVRVNEQPDRWPKRASQMHRDWLFDELRALQVRELTFVGMLPEQEANEADS